MLESLPPEILFYILEYLPLPSLCAVRQASKQWNHRFVEHEPYIYRNAAYYYGFISSPEIALEQAVEEARTIVRAVSTWNDFCRQRYLGEKNWLGRGTAWCKELAEDHDDVHRIKVDEERGLLITTHQDGGLNVRDLDTDATLWGLPRTYVRRYAHCEYGNGFIIFDRFGQGKELWRIASDPEESPAARDDAQQMISDTVNRYIAPTKGSFKPWAVLTTPEPSRAYRFVYPTLLVAGVENAYLWDVPRCQIVKVIPDIQAEMGGESLGRINYVEISALHVIICGSRQLRLFDKVSGACVWYLQTSPAGPAYRSIQYLPASVPPSDTYDLAVFPRKPESKVVHRAHYWQFVAVHVSPDGRTLAILTEDASLLLIRDILPVIAKRAELGDASLTVSFQQESQATQSTAIYLAFEHGRVGVVTSSGIFVVTLDSTQHGIDDKDHAHAQRKIDLSSSDLARQLLATSPFPFIHCCQILPFNRERTLHNVSCLQMSESKMYFTWDPRAMPGMEPDADTHPEFRWGDINVDFAEDVEPDDDWEDEEDDAADEGMEHAMPGLYHTDQHEAHDANHHNGGDVQIEWVEDEEEEEEADEWVPMHQGQQQQQHHQHQHQPFAPAFQPAHLLIQNMVNEAIVACVGFTPFEPATESRESESHAT